MTARFRLESILKHRRHLEDMAQKEFFAANRLWEQGHRDLEGMRHNRVQYVREMKKRMPQAVAAGELMLYHRYLERLDREIEAHKALVGKLAAEREDKRALLLTALKNRKMIEKLKERHIQTDARERQRQEQQMLNEAAINRYQSKTEASN